VGKFPALAEGRPIVLGLADGKERLRFVPGLLIDDRGRRAPTPVLG